MVTTTPSIFRYIVYDKYELYPGSFMPICKYDNPNQTGNEAIDNIMRL